MGEPYLSIAGLTEECLSNFLLINRVQDCDMLQNGLLLELHKRLTMGEICSILSNLVPEEGQTLPNEATLRKRVSSLELSVKKLRKSKNNSENVQKKLNEPFNLEPPKQQDTPRKKKLRQENKALKKESRKSSDIVKRLKVDTEQLEESCRVKETAFEQEKQELLESHQSEMRQITEISGLKIKQAEDQTTGLEEKVTSYQKRLGGVKSALSREMKKRENDSTTNANEVTAEKNVGTEIADVEKAIISVVGTSENKDILHGMNFYGQSNHKQLSSGKVDIYARISSNQPNSAITNRALSEGAKLSFDVLGAISGETFGLNSEKELLVAEMMRQNPEIFRKAAEDAGLNRQEKISVNDAISIKALARLSMNKIRDLRRCLEKAGCNFWPSERKMREAERSSTEHVSKSTVESGLMALKRTATEENTTMLPFLHVSDLKQFIVSILEGLPGERDPALFDNELWLLFAGDKDGGNMKFHIEIINSTSSGSVDNVHMFCLFEGADTVENLWKVFHVYRDSITELQQESFTIAGRRIRVFLGGDFHFLDDMLGHQGSAATYPSCTDLVTLDHLRNHGSRTHNPENCDIELRTIEHYQLNYNENLCDDRNNGNPRENGKYHCSVVDKMLFPIQDLGCIVPPVLHMLLGITLLLYNFLLKCCQGLDEAEHNDELNSGNRVALTQEWEENSLLLLEKNKELERIGIDVVEIENRIGRFEAVLAGDNQNQLKTIHNQPKPPTTTQNHLQRPTKTNNHIMTQNHPKY